MSMAEKCHIPKLSEVGILVSLDQSAFILGCIFDHLQVSLYAYSYWFWFTCLLRLCEIDMEHSQEHYVGHLAEVSKNNKVMLTEDIFNQKGVLVVKKGAEVDRTLAEKIAKHKLHKPLDNTISLHTSLTQERLLKLLKERLIYLNLLEVARKSGLLQEAALIVSLLTKYPLVLNKLTILFERLPDVFLRCLTMSILTLGLSRELKLSNQAKENTFLACLISEVGMLHIDPKLVNKAEHYTAQELKMLQGHVIIAKHFTDSVPNLPSVIGRAVLEHHERVDGFGYPLRKKGEALCIEGQILSIADKVSTISRRLVQSGSYSWTAVLSVIQIPSTAHFDNVHKCMIRLLKQLSFKYQPAFSKKQLKYLITLCIGKLQRLDLWFTEYSKLYINHKNEMADSDKFKPLALLQQLEFTVKASGVLNSVHYDWLNNLSLDEENVNFSEIEEFILVVDEIEEQCFFVMQKLVKYKDELVKRFEQKELLTTYYHGLMCILDPEEKRPLISVY